MAPQSRWPLRAWLLVGLVVATIVSGIEARNHGDFVLEILPMPVAVGFLWWLERARRPLSNVSYALLFVYFLLHLLGAHYQYSFVPYDEWSIGVFDVRISDLLHTDRNHYDRLIHLLFGVMLTLPMVEIVERLLPLSRIASLVVAVAFIAILSKLYELGEWAIALLMSPEAAEAYNGQQGDMFDAHKDMSLALAGSIVSAVVIWVASRALLRSKESPGRAGG